MSIHLYYNNNLNYHIMKTVTVKSELKRRMDLVNDSEFIKVAIKYAEKMGISADEWNNNKAGILMFLANEFCKLENKA